MRAARLLLLAAALLAAPLARAEGNGVLVGESARLHLSFETETRYDSLAALGGVGNGPQPSFDPADLLLHFRPGARLAAPGARLDFTASALLDWTFYTGLGGDTRGLSYLGATVDALAEMGKGGPLGFSLGDHFNRSDRSTNPALGVGTITDLNQLQALFNLHPGGGALEFSGGYTFALEQYELHAAANLVCTSSSCDGTRYGSFGSQTHTGLLSAKWRFLPKTAVFVDASLATRQYQSSTADIGTTPLRIEGGLVGLITEKVRALLKGGYGNLHAQSGENFAGWLLQAEATWIPAETAQVTAGLLRDAQPVSDRYAFYVDERAYLAARLLMLGRVQITGGAALDLLDFANTGRRDTVFSLNGAVEFELNSMLRAAVGAALTSRDSTEGDAFIYQRTEVYARLAVTY